MMSSRSSAAVSRRTALAGLGADGLGLALAARGHRAAAQRAATDFSAAAVATPAPTTAESSTTDADLVRATERERLRALVAADTDAAAPLHTDDFQLINPAGVAISKADYMGTIASGEVDYLAFEPTSKIDVRLYGETAVIRYQSRIEIVAFGTKESHRGWHTDVYEQHDGHWQVVWSQMTSIQ